MTKKLTYKFVKESFNKENYTLLSEEYLDSKSKLEYICSKGHEHSITWGNWSYGYRCPYCAGQGKPTIKKINEVFKKEDYILLSKEYKNNKTVLDYICPKGHKHNTTWDLWVRGRRCFHCSNNNPPTIEQIRESIESEGYILLSDKYVSSKSKLIIKCPKGHVFKSCWNNWDSNKRRCPICPTQRSKFEKDVVSVLNTWDIEYVSNNRTILVNPETNKPLELDIYFPELNKAIECNGSYWHFKDSSIIKRDKIKKSLCVEHSIDLLVISDIEWYNNKSTCRYKIKNFLNIK